MSRTEADLRRAIYADVQRFLRDYPQLNRLTAGRESSETDVRLAVDLALGEINATAPRVERFTLSMLPIELKTSFIYLTVKHLLASVMLLDDRNALTYQDGSGTVASGGQGRRFEKAIQLLQNLVGTTITDFKIRANLDSGFGGVTSEYTFLDSWLDSWVADARIS